MSAQIISFKADVNDVTRKMGILGKSISKVEALQKELSTTEAQLKRETTNLSSAINKYGQDSQEVIKIQNRLNNVQTTGKSITEQLAQEEELLNQAAKKAGVSHHELSEIIQSTGARLNGYNAGIKNSNGNYKTANGGMRAMRGGMAQLGYQVQDVAVQLQMGQNALLVFGQQGSQVASIFGAKGAMLGAVLAVGAALGTAFLPELFKTNNHLKELKERLDDAADSFDDLTEAQRAYLIQEQTEAIRQAQKEVEKYTQATSKQEANQQFLNDTTDMSIYQQGLLGESIAFAASQVQKASDNALEFRANQSSANQELEEAQEKLARLNGELVRNDAAIKSLIQSLEEEAATLGYTETQLALYEAGSYAADDADIARIETLRETIDAYEAQQQSIEDAKDAQEQAAKEAEERALTEQRTIQEMLRFSERAISDAHRARERAEENHYRITERITRDAKTRAAQIANERIKATQLIDSLGYQTERQLLEQSITDNQELLDIAYKSRLISEEEFLNAKSALQEKAASDSMKLQAKELKVYSDGAGGIAAILKEGSSAQRAALAVQKGLNIASVTMNMHAAVMEAAKSASFPANLPAIAMATSQGLAALAGIRSVSFEGGGFTGMGARAGGIDGRGGFPAVLHPNETVYDHTKGQGMGVNVSFNISTVNAQGFDELLYSRRGQIINMINQAVNNSGRRSIT